ncbi:MAG: 2-dehydropantoate 2-reductase [Planctomycetota bacterium]|nr:2-dehydropantoate 2-reductase [Planctomycetota bacterium]
MVSRKTSKASPDAVRFGSVTVFGAGALGMFLGARLSRVLPVTLAGRRVHIEAIRQRGVLVGGIGARAGTGSRGGVGSRVGVSSRNGIRDRDGLGDGDGTGGGGREAYRVFRAEETCPPIEPGALCLVCVKAYDVGKAARILAEAGAARAAAAIVFLQNGIGFEDEAAGALGGAARMATAVCHTGATVAGPGMVDGWGGEMLCEDTAAGRAFAGLLIRAGLEARICRDIKRERWKKIAMNCALNPLTAILGVRNRLTIVPELRSVRAAVIGECAAVAAKMGVRLAPRPLLTELEARASASNNVNSMLQDILAGRRTEVDYLNGFFERQGPRLGVRCPVNSALAAIIRAISAGRMGWRPPAL